MSTRILSKALRFLFRGRSPALPERPRAAATSGPGQGEMRGPTRPLGRNVTLSAVRTLSLSASGSPLATEVKADEDVIREQPWPQRPAVRATQSGLDQPAETCIMIDNPHVCVVSENGARVGFTQSGRAAAVGSSGVP